MTISCDKFLFSKIAFSRVKIRTDGLDESMSYSPNYIRTHKIHHMVRGKTKKKKKKKNRQQHRLLLLASLQL
jgi:hypothetical protein